MSMDQKDVEVSQDLLDPFGLRMSLYFAVPQMRFVGCLEAKPLIWWPSERVAICSACKARVACAWCMFGESGLWLPTSPSEGKEATRKVFLLREFPLLTPCAVNPTTLNSTRSARRMIEKVTTSTKLRPTHESTKETVRASRLVHRPQ